MTALPAAWVTSGQGTPTVCARHGNPATTHKKCQFVSPPPPWSYVLLLAGVFVFLIVMLVTRKTVKAPHWPYCADCQSQRRTLLLAGLGLMVVSVIAVVYGFTALGTVTSVQYNAGSHDPQSAAATAATAGQTSALSPVLTLGGLILLLVGLVIALRANPVAIAGGITSRDGQWVSFKKAAPAFAHQVTAALQAQPPAHAQPFATFGEPQTPYQQTPYQEQSYPQQSYPQQEYAEQSYQQAPYQQAPYPEPFQPEPSYPYPQQGYPQQGYPPQGYPQQGYPQH